MAFTQCVELQYTQKQKTSWNNFDFATVPYSDVDIGPALSHGNRLKVSLLWKRKSGLQPWTSQDC